MQKVDLFFFDEYFPLHIIWHTIQSYAKKLECGKEKEEEVVVVVLTKESY